jgi:hypothetical protein
MIDPAFEILNQRGTPMFFSDVFANRPTAGIVGRIFISTDTYAFYRDTGSGWDLIGGPGTGTITGSGTIGTLPIWNGTQVIGDSSLLEGSTKFTTTKDFQADGYYLSGMTAGSGALYWTSDRVTLANYNATGDVRIEVGGGVNAQTISGTNYSTTFYGNIIRNGGLSTQFLKADGSLDSNTYNTGSGAANQVAFWSGTNALSGENNLWWDSTNNYLGINTNTPSVPLDVHHGSNNGAIFNQTTATNNNLLAFQTSGNGRWRIGNFYNAGADDFGIFDVIGSIQPFTIVKTTGQTFVGSQTTASGRLVVNNASSDAHIQVVGANAPSIRIDNAGTGATRRFVMGLATATNNFIQGSTAGDICISTASASPLLFGMWQTINATEVMRISTSNNVLIGLSVDAGYKVDVNGIVRFITSASRYLVFNEFSSGTIGIRSTDTGSNLRAISLQGHIVSISTGSPSGSSVTDRLTIDAIGNAGLGVSPSTWNSNSRALQLPQFVSLSTQNDASLNLMSFALESSANTFTYADTGVYPLRYSQNPNTGIHAWFNAPTGTAGNTITFTQAMTLNASGNLGLGVSPSAKLDIIGTSSDQIRLRTAATEYYAIGRNSSSGYLDFYGSQTGYVGYVWGGVDGETMRILSSKRLLIGLTVDAGYKLDVNGYIRTTDTSNYTSLFVYNQKGSSGGTAAIQFGLSDGSFTTPDAARIENRILSVSASAMDFKVYSNGLNTIMTLQGGGNVGINRTDPQAKLHLNGTFRIDGQTSGTAGGSSGQHLIIDCDGTIYKIALLNN